MIPIQKLKLVYQYKGTMNTNLEKCKLKMKNMIYFEQEDGRTKYDCNTFNNAHIIENIKYTQYT